MSQESQTIAEQIAHFEKLREQHLLKSDWPLYQIAVEQLAHLARRISLVAQQEQEESLGFSLPAGGE